MNNYRNKNTIVITTNGPGEIVGWVTPLVKRIRHKINNCNIIVAVLPCQFAPGNEYNFISSNLDVDLVLSPAQSIKWILFNVKPNISLSATGSVLFLGGDPFWAYLLKRKLRYNALAYTEHGKFNQKWFDSVYSREIDGNLMNDAFSQLEHKKNPVKHITFFPGSRIAHIKYLVPLYKEIISNISGDYTFYLSISPFVDKNLLSGIDLSGFELVFQAPEQVLARTDLLVTIPGTNTAQAAISKVPQLVLVPLNRPEEIPLEGIAGYIDKIPVIGKLIKRMLVNKKVKKQKFFSHPNILAGRSIVPEMVGVLSPKFVADKIAEVISDDKYLSKIKEEAYEAMATTGVADKIVDKLREVLDGFSI